MPIDSSTGAIQFREVVTLDPSLDAKTIIQKARTWVTNSYRSANDVVQQYDPEVGVLIVKGQFQVNKTGGYKQYTTTVPMPVFETLTIEAKPGRYRVTLADYEVGAGNGGPRTVLTADRGTTSPEAYMSNLQKQVAGQSMERAILKNAEKNLESTLNSDRQFMLDIKKQSQGILQSLKQFMQKKAEKDW